MYDRFLFETYQEQEDRVDLFMKQEGWKVHDELPYRTYEQPNTPSCDCTEPLFLPPLPVDDEKFLIRSCISCCKLRAKDRSHKCDCKKVVSGLTPMEKEFRDLGGYLFAHPEHSPYLLLMEKVWCQGGYKSEEFGFGLEEGTPLSEGYNALHVHWQLSQDLKEVERVKEMPTFERLLWVSWFGVGSDTPIIPRAFWEEGDARCEYIAEQLVTEDYSKEDILIATLVFQQEFEEYMKKRGLL